MRCRCETPCTQRGALLPPLVAAAEPEPRLTREHLLLQEAITKEHNEYLQKHPEIQQILNDFVSAALVEKPDDVFYFARKHFAADPPKEAAPK